MQQETNQPQLMGAPDETGLFMPQGNNSWVYGDPSQSQQNTEINGGAASAPIQGMNGGDSLGGMSSAAAQSQRMKNPVTMAETHMAPNSEVAYQASLRSLLDRNVGYFVVATFVTSPNQPVTWQGILHSVGSDYVVIYQPDYERYVSGDLYSLKFVQFHNVKGVPYCAASQSWQGKTGM